MRKSMLFTLLFILAVAPLLNGQSNASINIEISDIRQETLLPDENLFLRFVLEIDVKGGILEDLNIEIGSFSLSTDEPPEIVKDEFRSQVFELRDKVLGETRFSGVFSIPFEDFCTTRDNKPLLLAIDITTYAYSNDKTQIFRENEGFTTPFDNSICE